jgi:hypothetical protein
MGGKRLMPVRAFALAAVLLFSGKTALAENSSTLLDDTPRAEFPELLAYETKVKASLSASPPLLNLIPLNDKAKTALAIVVQHDEIASKLRDPLSGRPFRNEVFAVRPTHAGDSSDSEKLCAAKDCWTVEIFNFTRHSSLRPIVDLNSKQLLSLREIKTLLPEIPEHLQKLANEIARHTPEVQKQLGTEPKAEQFVMGGTKTALNRTRCERSQHLCVAPTFVVGKRALWTIVDLVEGKVVGTRFTEWSDNAPIAYTEDRIRDEHILRELCQKSQRFERDGWSFNYRLTSSDGLEVTDLSYKGELLLKSAKNVDWHVSYSDKDGFGYSDAVGCPLFSAAAVVPATLPKTKELKRDGKPVGFEFHIDFLSKLWPLPCNYYYEQRFQFFEDGSFRIAVANVGRGCGEPGIYRPVMRMELPFAESSFAAWSGDVWQTWKTEKWEQQNKDTIYSKEGYRYRVLAKNGKGFYLEPGRAQFDDKGRGDNAWTYVVADKENAEEGRADLPTLGPCCNTNHEQGPEKFIGENPDSIENKKLIIWYVPQMQNDSTLGNEYCWGNTEMLEGKVNKLEYPCIAGPRFVPFEGK